MSVPPSSRSLVLKANRTLGAQLVDRGLIDLGNLEGANERFLQQMGDEGEGLPSLLRVLLFDLQSLEEAALLDHQIEEEGLGFLDFTQYALDGDLLGEFGFGLCAATWTVPFDRVAGFLFVASSYYLSPAVRQQWESQSNDTLIWYACHHEDLRQNLETWQRAQREAEAAHAPAAD